MTELLIADVNHEAFVGVVFEANAHRGSPITEVAARTFDSPTSARLDLP
ncbi:hypothetical protein JNW90_17550 [Micromonospora sp. STR1s_5]|nr:hypothetical protein [Micromonospora sp. STR1s_5]